MSDALERLRSRNRPTVPNRDASLAPTALSSTSQDISTSRRLDIESSNTPAVQQPSTQETLKPLETKQTTLRFEKELSNRLHDLCRENDICREVLIEAMFEYCEGNSDALEAVLGEAVKKNEYRQQIANQKRAKSMMQRFGS
jgi:predicted DNA-binding protein